MEPIGGASAIIAFLQGAQTLAQICSDFKGASKDRRILYDEARDTDVLLQLWVRRLQDAKAHPNDAWYQGILALAEKEPDLFIIDGQVMTEQYRQSHPNETWKQSLLRYLSTSRYIDPPKRGDGGNVSERLHIGPKAERVPYGPFTRFALLRLEMEEKVTPPKNVWKKMSYRAMWTFQKTDMQELQSNISSIRALLDQMLSHSIMDVSIDTNARVQDMARMDSDTNVKVHQIANAGEDVRYGIQNLSLGVQELRDARTLDEIKAVAKERELQMDKIMEWLSPLEFRHREEQIIKQCFPLTGKRYGGRWLLNTQMFEEWAAGRRSKMLCYGQAGAGKTFLGSIVLRHLRDTYETKSTDHAVLALYLSAMRPDITVENLLGSLIKQLMEFQMDTFNLEGLQALYNRKTRGKFKPSEADLTDELDAAIAPLRRTYIMVDGLDECDETVRLELIQALWELDASKTCIMTTSQPIESGGTWQCSECEDLNINPHWNCSECGEQFSVCEKCYSEGKGCQIHATPMSIAIEVETPEGEIEEYVKSVLGHHMGRGRASSTDWTTGEDRIGTTKFGRILHHQPELVEQIPKTVSHRAKGLFLLAKQYVDKLERQTSAPGILDALNSLPKEFDQNYEEIMQERILESSSETADLGMNVLKWLTTVSQPLTLNQLQQAIAIRPGDTGLRPYYQVDDQTIMAATAGLVWIDLDGTVLLRHLTAEKYLLRTRSRWFLNADLEVTATCLAYLAYEAFIKPCDRSTEEDDLKQRLEKYTFLSYAARNWANHARDAGFQGEQGRRIRDSAITLLLDDERLGAIVQAAPLDWDVPWGVCGIHMCGRYGLTKLVEELVRRGQSVDEKDPGYGQTALMYACRYGYADTAVELLRLNADADLRSKRGTTAMVEAIEYDHPEIVDLLQSMHMDVNMVYSARNSTTALHLAIDKAQEDLPMVTSLLKRQDLDINAQDAGGSTALMVAADRNHSGIIRLLIDHSKIELNVANHKGFTALAFSSINGNTFAVKALLAKSADPSLQDMDGLNALLRTIHMGQFETLKVLLDYRPSLLTSTDTFGRGALHYASVKGAELTVQLLLEKGTDPNARSEKHGGTPLHEAAREDADGAIQILLDAHADPDVQDKYGRTPYLVALQHGSKLSMDLLRAKLADTSSLPIVEDLPLWSLVKLGRIELVKARLHALRNSSTSSSTASELASSDPDTGTTILHLAIKPDQPDLLALLLSFHATLPLPLNATTVFGLTPLHYAALFSGAAAALALLAHEPLLDAQDVWGQTPLSTAIATPNWAVALPLVNAGAAIDARAHGTLQELLFAAVAAGEAPAVQRCIDAGADVQAFNKEGLKVGDVAEAAEYNGERRRAMLNVLRKNKGVFRSPELEDGAWEGQGGVEEKGPASPETGEMASPASAGGRKVMMPTSLSSPLVSPRTAQPEKSQPVAA